MLDNITPKRKMLIGGGAAAVLLGVVLLVGAVIMAGGGGDNEPESVLVTITNTPRPTRAPTQPAIVTPVPTASPAPVPPLGDRPYVMVIDKIGVNAPVESYGLDDDQIPIVPTGGDARDVVAWYNFSSKPGAGSNAVFAGHVTWFGAAVFYNLTSLANGDEIRLTADDGTEIKYTVSDVFDVSASDPNATQVMAGTPTDMLTIITCTGEFTDTGDPIYGGEYDRRHVVRATLSSVTPGSAVVAAGSDSGG